MRENQGNQRLSRVPDLRPGVDALGSLFTFFLAQFLCLGGPVYGGESPAAWLSLCVATVALRLGAFRLFGIYAANWRHVSIPDVACIGKAVLLSSVLAALCYAALDPRDLSFRILAVESVLFAACCVGARVARRLLHERRTEELCRKNGRRVLLYGSNGHSRMLARQFLQEQDLRLWPVGFVDDQVPPPESRAAEPPFLGVLSDLPRLIRDHSIQEVVIAKPGIPGRELQSVLQAVQDGRVRSRLLSDRNVAAGGGAKYQFFRDVELADLLKRSKVEVDLESVAGLVSGKTVLVTGAGGSIGSELAKQILPLGPRLLLVLDNCELNLYKIDQELQALNSAGARYVPVLADVKDKRAIESLVRKHRPEVVYHAAAYKHVHLVEANPFAGIVNNIEGTRNLLDVLQGTEIESFVLVSSDKAVNPTGVMGATKRACELLVLERARAVQKRFCCVRFGNVLGSSGSLIPLLKQQIREGGPVTITHRDMARYFMLVPEAVSLVLKASSFARPGDIQILKMGDPVRIVDIARNLITLLGRKVSEIPIVYTGLRPGEKMVEELYLRGDELRTEHPDILVLPQGEEEGMGSALDPWVDRIIELAHAEDPSAATLLMELSHARARGRADAA